MSTSSEEESEWRKSRRDSRAISDATVTVMLLDLLALELLTAPASFPSWVASAAVAVAAVAATIANALVVSAESTEPTAEPSPRALWAKPVPDADADADTEPEIAAPHAAVVSSWGPSSHQSISPSVHQSVSP